MTIYITLHSGYVLTGPTEFLVLPTTGIARKLPVLLEYVVLYV